MTGMSKQFHRFTNSLNVKSYLMHLTLRNARVTLINHVGWLYRLYRLHQPHSKNISVNLPIATLLHMAFAKSGAQRVSGTSAAKQRKKDRVC